MDPTFGPFEKWLSDDTERYAEVLISRREWYVRLFANRNDGLPPAEVTAGFGMGATLAEACANALNDVMARTP